MAAGGAVGVAERKEEGLAKEEGEGGGVGVVGCLGGGGEGGEELWCLCGVCVV